MEEFVSGDDWATQEESIHRSPTGNHQSMYTEAEQRGVLTARSTKELVNTFLTRTDAGSPSFPGLQNFENTAGFLLENEKLLPYDLDQRINQAALDDCFPSLGVSLARGLGSLGASQDIGCMEQLLLQCASALDNNDVTLGHHIMWVLNNIASSEGDPNQRVTACFLRGLVSRAASMMPNLVPDIYNKGCSSQSLTAVELAEFVDLIPWYRFGFCAANGAIAKAVEKNPRVHVLDFSMTHCMQWPTLIETLSNRPEGPPCLRLTVHGSRPQVPPFLSATYEQIGMKLAIFARTKNVPFEFRMILQDAQQLHRASFDLRDDEVLAVNCQQRLHYIPEETGDPLCPRDEFLRMVNSLNPKVVTLVEEDSNLTSTSLVTRLKAAFNYMWIPFDALETILPRESKKRLEYEGDIGNKIENIIACEGPRRIERLESKDRWVFRMKKAQFQTLPFPEDVIAEVKSMLDHHAAGWSFKREDDALLLTWKGHNAVFASTWVPST